MSTIKNPVLTVIIVNYNTTKLTIDCLKSIDSYPPKEKFEVILIDNGSESESVNTIARQKFNNYKLTIISNKQNLGFSKANNQGIKQSSGQYILLLNSDTEVKKDSINLLLDFAKNKSDTGAVGPRLLNSDGSVQESAFRFPTIIRAIRQYWLGEKNILDKYVPSADNFSEAEALVMAAFLITPKTLKQVGLLDERYFMFFEDIDYCKRIINSGLKIYYLPSSLVVHHHGASGKKITNDLNQWRRLVPSSKIYHGVIGHYIYNFVLWSKQKFSLIFGK